MFDKRKNYIIDYLTNELNILDNKKRYIGELLEDTLILKKKKKEDIIQELEQRGYSKIKDDEDYKYLLKMSMDSVSEENVEKLNNEHKKKSEELERIKSTSIQDMWLSELDTLEAEYIKYTQARSKL